MVPAEPPPEYSLEERAVLGAFIDLIRSKNPYTINDDGVIAFPGLREISIAGLNEVEAGKLISSDPAFRRLAVTVSRLPVEKRGSEGLKPFGYELFQYAPSTFAPTGDVPVPADYVVGAGDELVIKIFGSKDIQLMSIPIHGKDKVSNLILKRLGVFRARSRDNV